MSTSSVPTSSSAEWADRITACWRRSVEAIIEVGTLLGQAKDDLGHGKFQAMILKSLPFCPRTAQRLMKIAADPRILNATQVSHLPANWAVLHALTELSDEQFEKRLKDGTIRPDMQRSDISTAAKQERRANHERVLGAMQCSLPKRKYGVILADPEWRFEPWSRTTGMDRAADNHYPTSCTEVIAARDVPSIAARDCVLFLWATGAMMPHALLVMGAWGFDYKSQAIWRKSRVGTGYWFRSVHEILLVGTRGEVPAPAMGTQPESVIDASSGEHSAKPEAFLELIEKWYPTLPKIELNRRGSARPGWDAWGNEVVDPETGEVLGKSTEAA